MEWPCSIYLRDLFQFIDRPQLEHIRVVSYRFNSIISTTPAEMPRRRFEELSFGVECMVSVASEGCPGSNQILTSRSIMLLSTQEGNCDRLLWKHDGYVDTKDEDCLSDYQYFWHNFFPTTIPNTQCGCDWHGLREASLLFVHCHLLDPSVMGAVNDSRTVVSIRLLSRYIIPHRPIMLFKVRNRLTETTALGLLHFLHHLRDVAIEIVRFDCVEELRASGSRLPLQAASSHHNTLFRQLCSAVGTLGGGRFRLHCHTLHSYFAPSLECVWEMSDLFHFHTLYGLSSPTVGGPLLNEALHVLAFARRGTARQHIKCIQLCCELTLPDLLPHNRIDHVVRYFQLLEVYDFKQCTPSIHIAVEAGLECSWPSTCPREAGVMLPCQKDYHNREKCWWCGTMEFRLRNRPSGHEFRVHFHFASRYSSLLVTMQLLFD